MKINYSKYLNISSLEKQWGTYVTTVGYSKVNPHAHYPNQKHPKSHLLTWNRGRILNDYYVIYISKGKGVFGSEQTGSVELEAGTCFFLYPGVLHRYKPDPNFGWEEYWIGFNGYYIEQLMATRFFDPEEPFVYLGMNKDVLILFRKIIEEVQASLVGYHQQIAGLALQILGIVHSIAHHHEHLDNPAAKLIAKAKFIIQESFENNLDMVKLASELPMGYSRFRKTFKLMTGESPNQYHLNLRLERAKNLLLTTSLNITEIAHQTGFESVYYFSRLFKKKNGKSPLSYRNAALSE